MLSLLLTYYKQPAALDWQLERLESCADLPIELVIVDDGSNDGFAAGRLSQSRLSGTLVTISRDVAWNIPGARNWAFVFASNNICLTTDIDHRADRGTLVQAIKTLTGRGTAYIFERRNQNGVRLHPHTDSFLLDRRDFFEIGGYDERFSGSYGQNARDFGRRLARKLRVRRTNMELEVNSHFSSDSRSRSKLRNQIKFAALWLFPDRNLLRLRENIEVASF